jgi:NAD(P)-dependent dehydrogenase (short-subunit alcohol dehydrogenase family)
MRQLHAMADQPLFAGKTVLVTGCGQEVSEATARMLAQRGADGVLIGGRAIEQGQAVAAIISAAGCEAHFQPTDLTKLDDCAALIAKADEAFGRLDAIIFSAGMVASRGHPESPAEQLDHLHAVNVRAPFCLMRRAADLMRRAACPGTMINVLGLPADGAPPLIAAYQASQWALASLTASFAGAWAGDGIRVLGLDVTVAPPGPADARAEVQAITSAIALLATDPQAATSGAVVEVGRLLPVAARG